MLYLDINKIIMKTMKKLIMFGLVALAIQSCGVLKKTKEKTVEHDCGAEALYSYWDTIDVEFIGFDSSLFKGRVYREVAFENMVYRSCAVRHINIQNIETGKIHRLELGEDAWFKNGKALRVEDYPYDKTKYRFVGY
jgi:hypothetical protein